MIGFSNVLSNIFYQIKTSPSMQPAEASMPSIVKPGQILTT
jgi:hypothetical protein